MTLGTLCLIGCSGGGFETSSDKIDEQTGGSGGSEVTEPENTGGSTGAVPSTGTGGDRTGGGDTCIPKTCDEVTFELTGAVVGDGLVGSACG